jgi:hypothetical protein
MKKIIAGLSLLLTVNVFGAPDYGDSFTNGLVALYPFQGDTADYSGNHRDLGFLFSAPVFTSNRFGADNSALASSGALTQQFADPFWLSDSAFTCSFWLQQQTVTYSNCIVTKKTDMTVSLLDNSIFVESYPNRTNYFFASVPYPSDGQWHQVATSFDGVGFRIYLDGKNQKCTTIDPVTRSNAEPRGITFPMNGQNLSDVRFYDHALSNSELVRLNNWESHISQLPPYTH